jgi:hypothetical protein
MIRHTQMRNFTKEAFGLPACIAALLSLLALFVADPIGPCVISGIIGALSLSGGIWHLFTREANSQFSCLPLVTLGVTCVGLAFTGKYLVYASGATAVIGSLLALFLKGRSVKFSTPVESGNPLIRQFTGDE